MFACLFFGDSLALGTAAAVNARYPQHCEVRAVKGAASTAMLRWPPPPRAYDAVILSIGSNDDIGTRVAWNVSSQAAARDRRERVYRAIFSLRSRLRSRRVIWLLPYNRPRSAVVVWIASRFGDEVLDLQRFASRDGLHPVSYARIAATLLR